MKKKISIIGLGKLGASMVAAYASKGHKVTGVDINRQSVEMVNMGQAPVPETDLQQYIIKYKKNITATESYKEAVKNSDITFVIVPTPSQPDGSFSIRHAKAAFLEIAAALKDKKAYHLVVLTSTVLPGDCREGLIPILEKESGKVCGKDFGFCYNPEFIAIGSVIRDLLNPDIFLIGEYDKKSGNILEEFYRTINRKAPAKRMSIESAELAKISLNHYLTLKITYANMLAEIAAEIPGVDIEAVTDAIGHDRRIGKAYLRPGLGYGGPCFPRDNRAFACMASKREVNAPYATITDEYNRAIVYRMAGIIKQYAKKKHKIGIVGLSYKPNTPHAEESQAVQITQELLADGYTVLVFEPAGYSHAKQLLEDEVGYCNSLRHCLKESDVVFLSNLGHQAKDFKKALKGNGKKIIIDPWRQFSANEFGGQTVYIPLGRN